MDGSWFSQAWRASVHPKRISLATSVRPISGIRTPKGDRQMKPLEVVHLAAFLRVPEDEVLRHAVDTTASPPAGEVQRPGRGRPPSAGTSTTGASPPRLLHEPDRIPIRSGARGGTDQEMFLEDGPIGTHHGQPT